MLAQLRVRNLAILSDMSLSFGEGLNVLTGETGTGKSIIVDAIGLLAGHRASSEAIRSGETQAVVEAVLELTDESPVRGVLRTMGVDCQGSEIVLRRTLSADGRSRVFLNGWQTTVSALADLATHWIDVSGQFGQQRLLDESFHTSLLDSYAGLSGPRGKYESLWRALRRVDSDVSELRRDRDEGRRQEEFLRFTASELQRAQLRPGEEEELKTLHRKLAGGVRLLEAARSAQAVLDGEDGAGARLFKAASDLRAAARLDPDMESWAVEVEALAEGARRIASDLDRYWGSATADPDEAGRIDERLELIQRIVRKYGSVEMAMEERERVSALLSAAEDYDIKEKDLLAQRAGLVARLCALGAELTAGRKGAGARLEDEMTAELRLLGMPEARFFVSQRAVAGGADVVETESCRLGGEGSEAARLEIAPNPGEGARPLAQTVSGGELSRVLLALKGLSLSETEGRDKTFLFDEVDSGIGGETAERVGIRMKQLSQGRQVLCVTHLAQIACYADEHIRVTKSVRQGRTQAGVDRLDEGDRVSELARMMGGIRVSEKSLAHAGELRRRGKGRARAVSS